jgi:hypothetical protein
MAIVAFPEAYVLKRSSTMAANDNVAVDYLDDGEPLARVTGTSSFANIPCDISSLFETEKDDLVGFLRANASNSITWTIDGVSYIGNIVGSYRYNMTGNLYNVQFNYYAKRL